MGHEIPKQFISVYDKPVLVYTLESFQKHPQIDAIELVCIDGWHDVVRAYAKKYGIDFAPFKVKGENKYMIFFKAADKDAMTAAFTEYTGRMVKREKKPSVLAALQHFKELVASRAPVREQRRERER